MRHFILLIFITVINLGTYAQSDNEIVIGKIDSVYSRILGEQRKIWVHIPDGNHDTSQRYPVVYLLDGDAHFGSVAGMIQQLSEINGNTICPQMIVVGIPNTDRTRDLTPTHISSDPPMMDSSFSKTTGGGENFVAFIEKELMPHIDSAYPSQPYRMLIGHSFGGLTVMNVLTNHTKLFNAYIAIDPSMWYDQERFLKATEKKLTEKKYDGVRMYLGIANTMPKEMPLEKMLKDTATGTRHIRSIFQLDKFIKANPQNGLKFLSKYYGDDDHGSVPLVSEYDGLRFIFNYYRLKLTFEDFTDSSAAIVVKYKKHYETVSKEYGFKVLPPELAVNAMGYQALGSKQYSKAAAFFEMNIANYPNSGNVYDSYGDLFAAKKDTANAIVYYQKALAVKDNEETKQKLQEMLGQPTFILTAQQLQKYTGEYIIEEVSLTASLAIKDNTLWASVPGQGEFELVPVALNSFKIKNLDGYKIHFEMDGDKPKGFTSIQPNGTFKATLKQ
ncbi:MAG: alpha/beta hydrolase-fold protein [Ginsengibacter sp.]